MRKINRFFLSCLFGLLAFDAMADDNTTKWCEWWIDHNFEARTREPINADGTWSHNITVSDLRPGLHTLGLRVGDSHGLWSGLKMRHFAVVAAEENRNNALTQIEYWQDYNFAARQKAALTNNSAELVLDMSQLKAGLHTLTYRVGDSHGMWSGVRSHHFLRVIDPQLLTNSVRTLRYWIDHNHDDARMAPVSADGNAEVSIDASSLKRGLHVLTYQVQDEHGQWGAANTHHFMVYGAADLTGDKIAGYRYWFNYGPAVTVEVEPTDRLLLSDVVIPIAGVVPHTIPADYRLDIAAGTVWCPDAVTFGIRAFDNAGKETGAVQSDSIHMDVPVAVTFEALADGVEHVFDAPRNGSISAMCIPAGNGGDMNITVDGLCTVDVYKADGTSFEMERTEPDDDTQLCSYDAVSSGEELYILVYNAAQVGSRLSVRYHVTGGQAVDGIPTDLPFTVGACRQTLMFNAHTATDVAVYGIGGQSLCTRRLPEGRTTMRVPAGVYVVRYDNSGAIKVVVP